MIAQAYDINTVSVSTSAPNYVISGSSTNNNWAIIDKATEIKGSIKVGDTEISNKLFELMIKDFLSTAKEKYPEEFLKE